MKIGRLLFGGAAVILGIFVIPAVVQAATFTVNSTDDSSDGTCDHPFVSAAVDCTWRDAHAAAEADAVLDTITFDIDASFADDGDGQWTITASTDAVFDEPVIVTAADVWDMDDDRPGIKLKRATSTGTMITLVGDASEVKGLELEGANSGLTISADDVIVGTDCDGIDDDRERNVIHGFSFRGITLDAPGILLTTVTGIKVKGNYIGTLSDGVTMDATSSGWGFSIGEDADSSLIGYEEGTSGVCAPGLQRNVIGLNGPGPFGANGILMGGSTVNLNGAAATSPDHNVIAGNYIGIGADGLTDIAQVTTFAPGVNIHSGATFNTIGTDGDGIDDDLEGNVIGGWTANQVDIARTGHNRVAGNLVGFAADGVTPRGNSGSAADGVNARGTGNIVGYCEAADDPDICNDGGTTADQGNIVGNFGRNGIRLGVDCDDCMVAGNIVGTDATLTLDAGNDQQGIYSFRANAPMTIGGPTADYGNIIMFNDLGGILIDAYFSFNTVPAGATENYLIGNNIIEANDIFGIKVLGTDYNGTVGPSDGDILDNTIEDNGTSGLIIEASSSTVDGNTITGNGSYGLEILSSFRHDEPANTAAVFQNIYDALSPNNAGSDTVSEPIITDNMVDGNILGGILIRDADAENLSTLSADNIIGTNGDFDIRRDWYAAVEILDRLTGDVVTSGVDEVRLTPANNLSCTEECLGATFASAGGGEGVWGPTGIDYNDATTWFTLTDFLIDTDGDSFDYNPYTVTTTGEERLRGTITYSFDGDTSGEADNGHLPPGLTTTGIERYQIAEISEAHREPSFIPEEISPPVALTPQSFSDGSIRWNFRDTANNEVGFRVIVFDDGIQRVVAEAGSPDFPRPDLAYLDETGLEPSTEYCGRFVLAFNSADESDFIPLSCATTLAPDTIAPIVGVPDVVITQRVFLIEGVTAAASEDGPLSARAIAPIILFIGFVVAGEKHASRLRARRCTGARCRRTHRYYLVAGTLVSTIFFILLQFVFVPISVSADETLSPVGAGTTLEAGNVLKFVMAMNNQGTAAAEDVILNWPIESGLEVDLASVQSTQALAAPPAITDDQLSLPVGDIAVGETVTVNFKVAVRTRQGVLRSAPSVSGSNMISAPVEVPLELKVETPVSIDAFKIVKTKDRSTVYMIDFDGRRRPFPDEMTFYSWYPDFKEVRTLSDEVMASIRLGRPMLPRPGTWLVKMPADPKVYAVEPGNVLRHVPNETRAKRIYGNNWAAQVVDIQPGLFGRYQLDDPLDPGELPDGLIVTNGIKVCYVDHQTCREVSATDKTANRFFDRFIRLVYQNVFDSLRDGEPIRGQEEALLTDGP